MFKVNINMELTLPDECRKLSPLELETLLFEKVISAGTSYHLIEMAEAMADKQIEDAKMHDEWAGIISDADWNHTLVG